MKCRKCHKELPDGSKFCLYCGVKQTLSSSSNKRGNGLGSAVKRGKTWTAIWTEEIYPDSSAQKVHQVRRWKGGFPTKTAALIYASSPAKEEPAASPTLRQYYEGWKRSDYLDLGSSKQTAYDIAWKRWASLAGKKMEELTIDQLQACIDQETDTHYPARDMRTLMRHLYDRAVPNGHARVNLGQYIRVPPLHESEMEPFTEEELLKFWNAYAAGDQFFGYLLLMVYSGMMPGELFKFKKDMVHWDTNEIIGCGLKTKKRKEVPIVFPDFITPLLTDLIESSTSKVGYVLCMNRDKFYTIYHEKVTAIGVRDLPPYSCRHTTATALALGNIAPSVIQEVMRHTKFSTTQRYIHPDTSANRAAVNTMKDAGKLAKKE